MEECPNCESQDIRWDMEDGSYCNDCGYDCDYNEYDISMSEIGEQ